MKLVFKRFELGDGEYRLFIEDEKGKVFLLETLFQQALDDRFVGPAFDKLICAYLKERIGKN